MSEVQKGIFRNTKNDKNRHKLFNMVLHVNWDYISVKKGKIKTNTQKRKKQKNKTKNNNNDLFFT